MPTIAPKMRKGDNPSVKNSFLNLAKYLIRLILIPIGKIHFNPVCSLYLKEGRQFGQQFIRVFPFCRSNPL